MFLTQHTEMTDDSVIIYDQSVIHQHNRSQQRPKNESGNETDL